jgi:hypothetical protein
MICKMCGGKRTAYFVLVGNLKGKENIEIDVGGNLKLP